MPEQIQHDQDAELLLNALLGGMPDVGLMTWNAQGRITSLSERCCELMQLPASAAMGGPISVIADSPCGNFMRTYEDFSKTADEPQVEEEFELARDGESYWLKLSLMRCPLGCSPTSAFLLIVRDITVHRRSIEQARQTQSFFEAALRAIPDAAVLADTEGHLTKVSLGAERIFGYGQAELSGQPVSRLTKGLHWEEPALEAGEDGPKPVAKGGYRSAAEVATERILDRDALAFIDQQHIYRAVNQAYLNLWRKTREEIIGAHVSDIVGEDFYLKYIRPALKRSFDGESVNLDAVETEYPSGTLFVDARYTPYCNERGQIAGVLTTLRDVTRRHLTELRLQENQQRFEQAGEFAEFAVWELDVESRRPVDDSMLRRLLGYTDEDPLDSLEAWLNIVVEADRQRMIESFERILSGFEKIERLECRATKKNGELVYVEILIEDKLQHGKKRLVGISRDITSLVQEREELRKYEHMTQVVQDGLALIDREHVYRAVNRFYTEQHGYPPEVIVGKPVSWLLGEALSQDVVKPMLESSFAGHELHLGRWVDYPQSGRRRVELSFSPYRDEAGEITRVLATTRDITDNYLSQKALQESEEKFRAFFDHAPIGVVILDVEDGSVLDVNPAGLSMYGYQREEYLRLQPWDLVFGLTPQNFDAVWERVIEQPRSRFEAEHRRKDGSGMHVLVEASRMQLNGRSVMISTLVDISQQKQLELLLRQQQDRYRLLVESSNAILFTADPVTFRFSFVSPEAEKLLGYPIVAWLESADFWIDHLHPDDRQWVPEYSHSMVRQQKDHKADYRMIAADGRVVWLHDATSVIFKEKRVISLVGVMVDITAIKEAEAERQRLSEMIRQSTDAILLTNTDFYITYLNEAFTQLYGYSLEDLRGQRPEVLCAEANAEAIYQGIYSDLLAGRQVHRQLLKQRRDGSRFYCQYSITPLLNDRREVIAYMSSQRDISLQMQAAQALRESEEKYRQIVDTAHEGIWVVDAQARTAFVNPRLVEMLGYEPEEMLRRPLFDFVDDTNQELAQSLWERLLRETKVVYDFPYLRKDGTALWCHASTSVLVNDEGTLNGAMGLLTDISEQRQLTEALIYSQKMEAVGQLTGGIAHDFNNILGSILGFAELAQMRFGRVDAKLHEYLSQIEASGGRARDLIRQLLIFSRGENTQSAASIQLAPLIKEIAKMLKPMLPAAIEIRCELPAASPSVKVDPLHVQQLLMNLCINARDAIGQRGLITIEIMRRTLTRERCAICGEVALGDWVAIRVSDTGRGVDESLRDDIFQPFVTSKEVGEGSGMGLAVVRGIVNSYRGHLLLESTLGKGSVFEILLPEALVEAKADEPESAVEMPGRELANLSILAVDDDDQFSVYLEELLRDAGAEVVCCHSGMQALGRYQRDRLSFDIIITDQFMPGMSGTDMVQQLRDLGCSTPVLLCSGYGYEEDQKMMRQLRIVELLQKPVSRGALLAAIWRAVEN